LTREARLVLKNFIHSELESLPEHMENLDVKDRIDIVIKLLPYVLPRVQPVSMKAGEPIDFDPAVF